MAQGGGGGGGGGGGHGYGRGRGDGGGGGRGRGNGLGLGVGVGVGRYHHDRHEKEDLYGDFRGFENDRPRSRQHDYQRSYHRNLDQGRGLGTTTGAGYGGGRRVGDRGGREHGDRNRQDNGWNGAVVVAASPVKVVSPAGYHRQSAAVSATPPSNGQVVSSMDTKITMASSFGNNGYPLPPSIEKVNQNSSPGTNSKIHPVRRPDKGGVVAVRCIRLRVNNFPIKFNPGSTISHYDIDVKPVVPPKNGCPVKISKENLSLVREKLFSDHPSEFPASMTAYDGEKNIFSATPLPMGKFTVNISDGEDKKESAFICTITLVNELKLSKLKDYLCGKLSLIPRDILQGMDLVMKENPAKNMISLGRNFYPVKHCEEDDLGRGIAAFRGFQHSLKPTSQGLALSLDYSVLAFRKKMSVMDFLGEHIYGFNIQNFSRYRRDAEKALKGLKVTMIHRRTKQKYTVAKLTDKNTRALSFLAEDPGSTSPAKRVSLVNYFREKYNIDIRHKDIPCLDLGRNNKKNYVPMELCVLVEGQRYPKENLDREAGIVLKNLSLVRPSTRERLICDMVRSDTGPCGEVSRNFGIEVDMNMTKLTARVIGPPELKLGGPAGKAIRIEVDREKCQWNFVGKSVVDGKPIDNWAVLDFTFHDRGRFNPRLFIPKLIERCKKLGIRMADPQIYEETTMDLFSNVNRLTELLEGVKEKSEELRRGSLQFILCVMSQKDNGYKHLKWISETRVGLITQCCLSSHANKANDQYLANIALKINAKLGGSNVELFDRFPHFEAGGHVMFLGADVNHPASRSRNMSSPSVAAVVGSVSWPAANRYAARVRPQEHRKEKISNFGEMCVDLVETYARMNKVRPEKLVLFRDGVSESQFDMVLNEELQDLKAAFRGINYNPTITVIVAQKRHQTRLFPESKVDGGTTGNVPPGTVVDRVIVHPFDFDFYLCSHYGSLGTSKPTHYYVLWDEHNFSSDILQKLIYNLCFTFARCSKPVSLVPPVYYADLAAYRGRLYHEAVMEEPSPTSYASSSSSFGSSSLSSVASFEDRLFKLHDDLENIMFFV
ncbi:hypothetical protein MLD38_038587 [Melastoma candidum]|uniref:Uncharacterized protein n=1 Tax=Melastoma candidum TaxID=119954 RepID=A0ACB9KZD3_9MYRT|nr:hypothetical protein MLD38_038587 [Melastoma candidum]